MRILILASFVVVCSLAAKPVAATNAALQDLFFAACTNPQGALAARCGETPGATGDLSGDSESSLNPSQVLSGNVPSLGALNAKSQEARERTEKLRREDALAPATEVGPWNLLVHVRRGSEERDRTVDIDRERGIEHDEQAIEIGADLRVSPRTVFGALLAVERSDLEFDREPAGVAFVPANHAGDIERDTYAATFYGSFALTPRLFVDATAGLAWDELEITRNSVFQESTRTVAQTASVTRASPDGEAWWVSLNVGWEVAREAWSFGAYGGATYAASNVDGWAEDDLTGSGLAMRFGDVERTSLIAHAGLRAQVALSTGVGVFVPQLRAEVTRELDGEVDDGTARYRLDAAATTLELRGDDADDGFMNVGGGLLVILPGGWMPFVDIELLIGDDDRERSRVTAGLRKDL